MNLYSAAVLCGQISFAIPLAQAWRAKNLLRTNVCLLDLVREKFKQCTSQWVSLFTTASTMGLAPVYDDIKILWREVYRKEVQACEAQNEAAVKSLFPTMFISDTERALFVSGGGSIVNFSKAGILTVFMDIINAGNTIQFKKSQEKWQSNNTVETKAMQEKLRCMKADQFLCIYGHKAPGWMMNDSSRSTFSTVKRFNTFRSDSHLLFRDDNTIVTRVCRISDNPAALVPLTATHSKVRFRILASDNSGSAISFGICDKNFTASGSIGIGPSLGTWGVFENKDLPYPATVYADGVKVATWRTFVAGDSISIECDTSLVRANYQIRSCQIIIIYFVFNRVSVQ